MNVRFSSSASLGSTKQIGSSCYINADVTVRSLLPCRVGVKHRPRRGARPSRDRLGLAVAAARNNHPVGRRIVPAAWGPHDSEAARGPWYPHRWPVTSF